MLRDRQGNADNIDFLKGILADQIDRDLACNNHHRAGIHVCCSNTGDRIGRPRSAGRKADSHFACGTGVTVRSMSGALLMAGQYMFDSVLVVVKSIVQRHDLARRDIRKWYPPSAPADIPL